MKIKAIDKKSNNWIYWFAAAAFIFVPLISATLFCLKDGKTINELAIYLSGWSDELIYYKQIEGMVEYGVPRGYFGYDQARAMYGPFAVWGIFPLLPYFFMGKIVGFNYLSMPYINILICMLALMIFVLLVRPRKLTMLTFSLVWMLYYDLNRHIVSGMVESVFIAALIVVFALGCYLLSDKVRCQENRTFCWKNDCVALVCIIVTICYMSICRPYFSVLFLIPFMAMLERKKYRGCVVVSVVAGVNLIGFFVNYTFFCAKYFRDILGAESLAGISIKEKVFQIIDNIVWIFRLIWYSIRYADVPGWSYLIFCIAILFSAVYILFAKISKNKSSKMLKCVLIGYILVLLSIVSIYDVGVGARHIMVLNIGCILLLATEIDYKVNWTFVAVSILSLALMKESDDMPYVKGSYEKYINTLKEELAIVIRVTDEISYDNVIAMPMCDYLQSDPSQVVVTYYGNMYAVPAGMGISLDNYERYEDLSTVNAKYIMCHPKGVIYDRLIKEKKKCIYENDELAICQMYE